ncbi:mitochondrial carrier [Annulohypoxylon truncatum]|uniref:mitochondrial carrier n=1 Tax=Annulohypoxylon truncatum TaxID=327061 RepID=UPI002008481A|nr:mitochondrial carrier [Annulohypoxylon truncatum]KAI1211766.1 mitochondrial carrier [Annulohypoxylon truncatum]
MSHDEAQSPPTGRSSHDPAEYGVFAHRSSPTVTPTASSANTSHQDNQSTLASAVTAMELHDPRGLTPLQRWAADASDSQFNALSGAVGGFTSGIVTCPLDVIKTKLQAQGGFRAINKGRYVGHHKVYSGLVGTARVIWKEEGLRGMYRGLGPIILGYLPTWAVWFTVYNKSKVFMAEKKLQKNQFFINFWSSIVAGASSTIVTNPIWVIKTRLMSQSATGYNKQMSMFPRSGNTPTSRPTIDTPWHYRSTLDAARKMYSSEGILSFYSGLTPALLGLTHVAVQFPAYEFLRKKFTGQAMGEMTGDDKDGSHWLGVLSASIMSKIMASSATYPHEVIRTRLQTQRRPTPGSEYLQGLGVSESTPGSQSHVPNSERSISLQPKYRGVVMTFRTILREEGWRAFYAGMGVNMMRAVPAATVTMMTYELVMKNLHRAQSEGRQRKNLDETAIHEP